MKRLRHMALMLLMAGAANAADLNPLALSEALQSASARTVPVREIAALSRHSPDGPPDAHFAGIPWTLLPESQAGRLLVAALFLEAVLADLQEAALNESIAMAFIRWERARAAKPDDTVTLALDAVYRDLLLQRSQVRVVQREARSLLAIALGNAANVPGELLEEDDPAALGKLLSNSKNSIRSLGGGAQLVHSQRLVSSLADEAEGPEMVAAKARLALAEARQDAQRLTFEKRQSPGLELGDAMAAVAHAQRDLRIAQYRAALYRQAAIALGVDSAKTP